MGVLVDMDTVGEFAFEPFSVEFTPSSASVECDDRRLLRLRDLLQCEFANSIHIYDNPK